MLTKDALEKIEFCIIDFLCNNNYMGGFKAVEVAEKLAPEILIALSTLLQQVGEEVGKMKVKKLDSPRGLGDGDIVNVASGYNQAIDDVRSRLDSVISSYKKG
jgi:hypothetical protein